MPNKYSHVKSRLREKEQNNNNNFVSEETGNNFLAELNRKVDGDIENSIMQKQKKGRGSAIVQAALQKNSHNEI